MPVRLSQKTSKGAEAAQKAMSGRGRPGSGLGRAAPRKQGQEQPQVGRAAPQQNPDEPQDMRYIQLGMQHFNMKGLGRDIPYGVWATLTGNYRQYAEPGHPPFDVLEDT